jgi:hypothetical protein
VSLEARRTPVPAADFHDSGEYDDVDSGEYYCADDYANEMASASATNPMPLLTGLDLSFSCFT